MQEQILKEVRSRLEADTRSPQQLLPALQFLGMQMFMEMAKSRTLHHEQVVDFCAGLIKLFADLSPAKPIQLK